ncbi:MAG TPA: hypothetical protein VGW78_05095 [Candidatus Babeliales bacterium]|jgi:hypothetical protein|nr:hypothetical protein [Candidatus Babeliales bacterium]
MIRKVLFTILTSTTLPIALYGIAANNEADVKKLKQKILNPERVQLCFTYDDSIVIPAYQERLKLYKEQCQVKITDPQCSFNNLNELAHLIECVTLYNDMEALRNMQSLLDKEKYQHLRAHYMFRGYNAYWQAIYQQQLKSINQ